MSKIADYIAAVTAAGAAGIDADTLAAQLGTTRGSIRQMNIRARKEKRADIRSFKPTADRSTLCLTIHLAKLRDSVKGAQVRTVQAKLARNARERERQAKIRAAKPKPEKLKPRGRPKAQKPPTIKPPKPPAPVPFWQAEAIIPDSLVIEQCPSGQDFRFTAKDCQPFFAVGATLPLSGWAAAVVGVRA